MLLKNIKKRKERLEKIRKIKKCSKCDKILGNSNKSGICSNCQTKDFWKSRYENQIIELERRIKLYDITINSLLEKLRKYEPIVEELDN